MHDFGDQLVEVGFSTPVMDMEVITVTYDTPQALLADVRASAAIRWTRAAAA
jgi:malonyl-CoA O-methyltransferase